MKIWQVLLLPLLLAVAACSAGGDVTQINDSDSTHNSAATRGLLFAGTAYEGILRSTDSAQHWVVTDWSSVHPSSYLRVNKFSANSHFVFATTYGSGLLRSSDGGATWRRLDGGLLDSDYFAVLAQDDGTVLAASPNALMRSTDNGNSWTFLVLRPQGLPLEIIRSGNDLFAASNGGGVSRSTDNGVTWSALNVGVVKEAMYCIVAKAATLCAGSYGGYLYRSVDRGEHWSQIPATNTVIDHIATVGNSFIAGTASGVLRSTDDGLSWSPCTNLPDGVFATAATIGKNVFVGSGRHGVLMSSDEGISWIQRSVGLTDSSALSLGVQ
jgi:photosystem II stability/assembly factor-like uncharacterized protein